MKYPYFRLTNYLRTHEECLGWFEYLKNIGIPVAIEKKPHQQGKGKVTLYAVWRIGEKVLSEVQLNSGQRPNSEPITGEIVQCANGFEHYLERKSA